MPNEMPYSKLLFSFATKKKYFISFLTLILGSTILLSPASIVHAEQAVESDELFFVAQKAFDDGFYDVAIRYIEQYLFKYPQQNTRYVQVQLLLGQCYFFKNQYLKAYEIFQSLVNFPDYKDATTFWLGETYFKGADFNQARKYYQQLLKQFPQSAYIPQTYYSLGWSYFDQGQYEAAKTHFLKLWNQFPQHELAEDTLLKLGECEYNLKNYDQAISYFQNYLARYPSSTQLADVYFYLAESYYYINDFLTAVTYYAKTADATSDPKISVLANISMGWSYLKLGKPELSEKYFILAEKSATANKIPKEEIYLGLANLYHQQSNLPKAIASYAQLIQEYPDSPRCQEAHLDKAAIFYEMADYPAAITEYQWIIDHASGNNAPKDMIEKAYFGIAWTYLKSGDVDTAIKSFEKIFSTAQDKNDKVSALIQIGDAYQELEKFDKAIPIYDRILNNFPDSIYADYAQFRQGIALLQLNRLDAAMMSFLSLQTNFPKSKYLNDLEYYLGIAYFKKNDFPQAIQHLGNYLALETQKPEFVVEAQFVLGLSYFSKTEYAKALPIFQKLSQSTLKQRTLALDSEFYMAKCLYHLKQVNDALKLLKDIIQKYPASPSRLEAQIFLGDYYLQQGDFAVAEQEYEQALKDFPGSEKKDLLCYELGQAYQAQEKFDQALNYYKRIPKTAEKELFAKAQLAIADIFAKDIDAYSALQSYQTIAQTIPDFKRDAYAKIASIHIRNKEYPKALAAYQQALQAEQARSEISSAELQFKIGDTYEMLNRPDEAVDIYLKIPYLYGQEKTWCIKAYLRMARIFEEREKWEDAQLTYKKIIEFNTDESKYAQERLDWIKNHLKKK